ncbi:MAG: hypothetical protein Q9M36_04390 [Sulfurovum sp.]|nr:hypothetical protein [Sulfurovum sp.]
MEQETIDVLKEELVQKTAQAKEDFKVFSALKKEIKSYQVQLLSKDKVIEVREEEVMNSNSILLTKDTLLGELKSKLTLEQNKYKLLEASSLELYTDNKAYKIQVESLENDVIIFKGENKTLREKVKKAQDSTLSIRALKSQQLEENMRRNTIFEGNIEVLLSQFINDFKDNTCSYTCFELILYALSSKKGMSEIEEVLQKSKVLEDIIDRYYFKGDLVVFNEKNSIAVLIKRIVSYEKNAFSDMIQLKVHLDSNMPTSLVFDSMKIQNIILHLVRDLHQFIQVKESINIDIRMNEKYLEIELGGTVYEKNSLLKTMFQHSRLELDNKERTGLQLSRKVIERLRGNITYVYTNNYYKFILTVPTQVIKL